MEHYFYEQQSFFINDQNELSFRLYDSDISKIIEEQLPWVYDEVYENLKNSNLEGIDLGVLERFMRFVFNDKNNFYDISICSRDVQIQAFNLFNECFYCQLRKNGTLTDDTFQYIEHVMSFGEKVLYFTPSTCSKSVDFSVKGLVKSEIYKHQAYMRLCQ